jgi:hypothetical protein
MAEEVVEVTIGPDGAVDMAVAGVGGMQCVSETDDLVQLLGGEIVEQRLTDEAYLDVEDGQQEQQWGY